ncbi:MAG: hypothetical protein ACOZNI_06185 [Myxococcota bacterium]
MTLALLLACAHRRDGAGDDAPSPALAEGDALWATRASDPAALDAAVERWLAATADDPEDPAPLARLSRAEWVRALTRPDEAAEALETGTEYGWRCLYAFPAFASAAAVSGYRVDEEAVGTLGRDAVPCLAWLANNGLDRVALRGPGGALDLEGLALVVRRAAALAPAGEGGMVARAEARWLVLTGGDRAAARAAFERAIAAEPGFLLFRVDLAEAFPDEAVALPEASSPDPWALENAAARARAKKDEAPGDAAGGSQAP